MYAGSGTYQVNEVPLPSTSSLTKESMRFGGVLATDDTFEQGRLENPPEFGRPNGPIGHKGHATRMDPP